MEEQDQEELEMLSQWNLPDRYKPLRLIGGGSYSTVCEALDKETKKSVAIKRIDNLFECLTDTKRILREIQLLRKISHRFIVKLFDLFIDTKESPTNFTIFYIVLELCTSDLHKLTKLKFFLSEKQIKTICYHITIGLCYLHTCGVWHRDLKPGNILVNDDCTIKITDFGLARSIGESMQPLPKETSSTEEMVKKEQKKSSIAIANSSNYKLTQHVVTRWYRAPELILVEKKYTDRIDIWALGCIFAEVQGMLQQNFPDHEKRWPLFPGSSCFPLSPQFLSSQNQNQKAVLTMSKKDQLNIIISRLGEPDEEDMAFINDKNAKNYLKTFKGNPKKEAQKIFHELYPYSSKEVFDLLKKMLQFSPNKRIGIQEVLSHDYFNSVRDKFKEQIVQSKLIEMDFEDDKEYEPDPLRKMFMQEIDKFEKQESK